MWINIVEDEHHLNAIMATYLEKEGYKVRRFLNGTEALEALDKETDLWVIDIMLPDINGFTVFNKIKERRQESYIIFVSARNKDIDRVVGLEMGCDDYISKPFMTQELIIRVNKLLKSKKKDKHILRASGCEVHLERHKVFVDGCHVDLSVKEYEVLLLFINNVNRALSRDQILERIWEDVYGVSSRVVDDTVRRVRKKIPTLKIENVYGYGYIYEQ